MKKPTKNTKTIPTKPKNPTLQNKPSNSVRNFNPYNKQFTQQLDALIQQTNQPMWNLSEYECTQIVDKIAIAYKLYKGATYKLKYLKILTAIYKKCRYYFGQTMHILIDCLIQYPDAIDQKLSQELIEKYFIGSANCINHIDLPKIKTKLSVKPNSIILWKIIQNLTQKIPILHNNQKKSQLALIIIKAITNLKKQQPIQVEKLLLFFSKFLQQDVTEFYKCVDLFELCLKCLRCDIQKLFLSEILRIVQISINQDERFIFYSITFFDHFRMEQMQGFKLKLQIESSLQYTDKEKFLVISRLEHFITNILAQPITYTSNNADNFVLHIQRIFYLFGFLFKLKPNIKSIIEDDNMQIGLEEAQDTIFSILFSIEKNLINYPLLAYYDVYLTYPYYFQMKHFQLCLETYPLQDCTRFMGDLLEKWIDTPLRPFELKQMIFTFITYSFSQSNSEPLINLINSLKHQTLASLSILIYRQSFDEKTQKKIKTPRTLSSLQNFAQILSAGYCQKTTYVDRYFGSGLQNLQWMPFLQDIIGQKQYYLIRYYFFILNLYFIQNKHKIHEYINMIFTTFETSISKLTLQSCCGLTQLLTVLLFQQISPKQGQILASLFCKNFKHFYGLYEQSYNSRTSCMKYMNLTTEDVTNNLKALQKAKKMHKVMLKNWIKLLDILGEDIYRYIPKGLSYQDISQQLQRYGKYSQTCPYSIIRRLSCKASSKRFFNQVSNKLNEKIQTYENFMMYRQMIFAISEAFTQQQYYELTSTISCEKILQICMSILQQQLEFSSQRQLLKCKLLACQILKQMKVLCQNRLAKKFLQIYLEKLKDIGRIALKILYREKKILGKYERDLIMHIRCFVLNWILEDYHSEFQLISIEYLNRALSILIIDECYEIRLFIMNSLWSKYKLMFQEFRSNTHYNLVFLTIAAIFQPNPRLKLLAQKIVYSISFSQQFLVILALTASNVALMMSNFIPLDIFIRQFLDLWFRSKQTEYLLYVLVQFLYDNKETLATQLKIDINLQSVMTYYISRTIQQKKLLENPEMTHSQVIYNLFLQSIKTKPRSTRILKSKKDIQVDLNAYRKHKLLL